MYVYIYSVYIQILTYLATDKTYQGIHAYQNQPSLQLGKQQGECLKITNKIIINVAGI